jgi:hypothetical protein
MSNALVLVVGLAAVAVAVLMAATTGRRDTARELDFAAIKVDPAIGEFLDAIHICSSEDEDRYLAARARLRADPVAAARYIEAAYQSATVDELTLRQSLLLAAAALEHPAVLPFLGELARRPVTGEIKHDGGRAAEESALRLVAVDGIDAIARTGNTQAADLLVALVASPDRAVQAAAVIALKYSSRHRDRFEEACALLPADRGYLIDVRRADVREVPQIADPRRHLRGAPFTTDTRPDPVTFQRRNDTAAPGNRRAPHPKGHS